MFKKLQAKLFPTYEANHTFMVEHHYDYTLMNHIGYVSFLRLKKLPVLSIHDMVQKTGDDILETINNGITGNIQQKITRGVADLCLCVKGLNKAARVNFTLPEVDIDLQKNGVQIAFEPHQENRAGIYTMRHDRF